MARGAENKYQTRGEPHPGLSAPVFAETCARQVKVLTTHDEAVSPVKARETYLLVAGQKTGFIIHTYTCTKISWKK